MTNELGLELDKTAQYDVTQQTAMMIVDTFYNQIYFDLKGKKDAIPEIDYQQALFRLKKDHETIRRYIQERP